jgi:hypothetical protein
MKKSPLLGGDQGVGLGMHPLELEQNLDFSNRLSSGRGFTNENA